MSHHPRYGRAMLSIFLLFALWAVRVPNPTTITSDAKNVTARSPKLSITHPCCATWTRGQSYVFEYFILCTSEPVREGFAIPDRNSAGLGCGDQLSARVVEANALDWGLLVPYLSQICGQLSRPSKLRE